MKQFVQNEEAVSPVIGVILMVAITVILAAVIAAFVFGMAGNISKTYSVAATASHTTPGGDQTVAVTYQGGPDASEVSSLSWLVNGVKGETLGTSVGSSAINGTGNVTITADKNNHVVVTATFNDGSSQVILDTYV